MQISKPFTSSVGHALFNDTNSTAAVVDPYDDAPVIFDVSSASGRRVARRSPKAVSTRIVISETAHRAAAALRNTEACRALILQPGYQILHGSLTRGLLTKSLTDRKAIEQYVAFEWSVFHNHTFYNVSSHSCVSLQVFTYRLCYFNRRIMTWTFNAQLGVLCQDPYTQPALIALAHSVRHKPRGVVTLEQVPYTLNN